MKNLLKKLSRTEDRGWRDEIERQAADEIKSLANQRPAEASADLPQVGDGPAGPSAPSKSAEGRVPAAASTPPEGRRLTAQQRAAARQLQ